MKCDNNKPTRFTGQNDVTYCIIQSECKTGRTFGIMAEASDGLSDFVAVKNLFFTADEAESYCRFLAENNVLPYALSEVLSRIFVF